MDAVIERSVERVIRSMHDNLGEPITIDDMARTAMFSKYHFSRMFQRVTGISPGRFLSALRLQEAKRLLLTSSLTVADIAHLVGYNSIGTFSSRFRVSVGISPTTYRQFGGFAPPLDDHAGGTNGGPNGVHNGYRFGRGSLVEGVVRHHVAVRPGPITIGLFTDRIAQGMPVRHVTSANAGPFVLRDVPAGTWYLIGYSWPEEIDMDRPDDEQVHVTTFGPITVGPDRPVRPVDLWLRGRRIFDPPALLAQLDQPTWVTGARAPGGVEDVALPGA